MKLLTVDTIPPEKIGNAFGKYAVGITHSMKGEGNPDDGSFTDFSTGWHMETAPLLKERYLTQLVKMTKARGVNFIEFWGWPEVRYRDDGMGMVYSRLRWLNVVQVYNPRPWDI